jgi:hypothetical protein
MLKHSTKIHKLQTKKFYNIAPKCQRYKTVYSHKLLFFVISYSVCSWQAL